MSDFYIHHARHYVAVDCIIFGLKDGKLEVLLTRRAFEPEKGKWSLMGGFVEENESVDNAASRVLRELTGIDDVYMRQVATFGALDRDPGERVISVAYYALLNVADVDPLLLEEHNAHWVDISYLPALGFDHPAMIRKALEVMRRHFMAGPLAFKLLPPLFTLSQFQALYELVFGQTFDKRNFRKRIAENACIEVTDIIDKTGSKRGARLYRYNEEVYLANPYFKI